MPRLATPLADGTAATLVIATDGELYGHHQPFRDLFLQRLVAPGPDAPDRGFDVVTLAELLEEPPGHPQPEIRIRERHPGAATTASCAGAPSARASPTAAGRRRCAPPWNGSPAPSTRSATRLAADLAGLDDIWAARDGYVDVVIGLVGADDFAPPASARGRAPTTAAGCSPCSRRSAGASRCSPRTAGTGTTRPGRRRLRNLLAAARAVRLVDGLAGTRLERRLVADLSILRSPARSSDGATIYRHALAEAGQPPAA